MPFTEPPLTPEQRKERVIQVLLAMGDHDAKAAHKGALGWVTKVLKKAKVLNNDGLAMKPVDRDCKVKDSLGHTDVLATKVIQSLLGVEMLKVKTTLSDKAILVAVRKLRPKRET